jgi:hypothetical protein
MGRFVLKPNVVESCMWALSEENIHRHFAGYLGIKRTCEVEDTRDRVFFDYDGFFNAFFKVRDDDEDEPYLHPFDTSEIDERSDFGFNENVAGSYSTSSIRDHKPFAQVVDYGGSYSDRWWTLVDDHLDIAWREMLEAKVPVEPLAGFLYRDFAVEAEESASIDDFVEIFREEFGFEDDDEFDQLFRNVDIDYENPVRGYDG